MTHMQMHEDESEASHSDAVDRACHPIGEPPRKPLTRQITESDCDINDHGDICIEKEQLEASASLAPPQTVSNSTQNRRGSTLFEILVRQLKQRPENVLKSSSSSDNESGSQENDVSSASEYSDAPVMLEQLSRGAENVRKPPSSCDDVPEYQQTDISIASDNAPDGDMFIDLKAFTRQVSPLRSPMGVEQSFLYSDECLALPSYDRLDIKDKIRLSKLRYRCSTCTYWCTAASALARHQQICKKKQEPYNPMEKYGGVKKYIYPTYNPMNKYGGVKKYICPYAPFTYITSRSGI